MERFRFSKFPSHLWSPRSNPFRVFRYALLHFVYRRPYCSAKHPNSLLYRCRRASDGTLRKLGNFLRKCVPRFSIGAPPDDDRNHLFQDSCARLRVLHTFTAYGRVTYVHTVTFHGVVGRWAKSGAVHSSVCKRPTNDELLGLPESSLITQRV